MKQHITASDLEQLSEKGKERLREWWDKQPNAWFINDHILIYIKNKDSDNFEDCHYPLLFIGELIEFLDWKDMEFFEKKLRKIKIFWQIQDGDYENAGRVYIGETLCDALWQAVKEKLES